MSAQVIAESFAVEHIRSLNKVTKLIRDNSDIGLIMHFRHVENLHLKVFSDASFANNPDYTSQLGYLIFLCDSIHRANLLQYTSYKSKHVVRSILGGEV